VPGIHREQWAHEHQQRRFQEPPESRWKRGCGVVLRWSDSGQWNVGDNGNDWFSRQQRAGLERASELHREAFLGATEFDARFRPRPDGHAGGTTDLDARLGQQIDVHPSGTADLDTRLGPHVDVHAGRTAELDPFRKAISR
jgi:hypothetical protein